MTDRECPELPQPEEIGSVNITGREFGGKAVYSCPIGYNVVGVIIFLMDECHLNDFDKFYEFPLFFAFTAINEIVPQWYMDGNAANLLEKQ